VSKLLASSPAPDTALGTKNAKRHRQSPAHELGGYQVHLLQVKNAFFQEALLPMGEGKGVPRPTKKNKNLFNVHLGLANFFCKWLDSKYLRHCGPYALCHTFFFGFCFFLDSPLKM